MRGIKMKKNTKKLAAVMTATLLTGALSITSVYAANNTFGIDEINWTAEDWASIAMTNDDTVDTGAVIRKEANTDSDAAGYLYRGAAAKVVEKGEEWTLVESGRVTGYVKNEFLTFGEEARGLAAHYGEQGVVANWNDVNVFSKSAGDASVSGTVNDGTVLGTIQDNGHWIAVQQGADSAGYVSEEDVTRVLLVDTAVPAQGEDDEDVVVTMSAADLDSSDDSGSEEASAEVYAEESYEETTSYDDSVQADAYVPQEDTNTIQKVSDDPNIQALYEAYLKAQEAAMNCTSEEDARQKAEAATAAWNAYLAACGGTPAADTAADSSSSASTDTDAEYDDSEADDEEYDDSEAEEDDDTVYAADDDTYLEEDTADYGEEDSSEDDSYEEDTSEEDTTSDAVAAASSNSSGLYGGASDLDLLAAIIWCEAGNQPYDGMVAVGQVVMNRVKSGSFPNTIAEVLNQPGQFTPSSSGTLQAALSAGVNSTCYSAAQDALNGSAPVPGYPLYFNTHSGSYKLGAHYFS